MSAPSSTTSPARAPAGAEPRRTRLVGVDAIASLDALDGDEWAALARRSGNLFATPEWLTAWWRHFGEDRRLALFAHRRPDGELAVLVPMYHARALPLRTLRFLGHGPGDWLGPIHAPGDEALGAAALRAALRAHRGAWDVLVAEQVPRTRRLARAVRGHEVHREGFPELTIAGRSWDELLAARSANFRQQVRRRERRLARDHDVTFRLADDPARLDEDMTTLLGLHDARWEGESDALGGAREGFQREFARTALDRGWLRLWFLELDGRPVAAWHGFRYAGDEWYYQAGRDPAAERLAVGAVLLAHTVRAAAEDGVVRYRLLRGGEAYKYRWADDDPELQTFLTGGSARGRAALLGTRALGALPGDASRKAERMAARLARVRGTE